MRRLRNAAALAACLAAPAVTRAQPAFATPPSVFTLRGCGDAFGTSVSAPVPNAVCVTGLLEIGTVTGGFPSPENVAWYAINQTTSPDLHSMEGAGLDPDQPGFTHFGSLPGRFALTFEEHGLGDFGPDGALPADLARNLFFRYRPVPNPDPSGSPAFIDVALTFTPAPEPAPLALTAAALGGVAVLGTGVRRRTGSA